MQNYPNMTYQDKQPFSQGLLDKLDGITTIQVDGPELDVHLDPLSSSA